MSIFQTVESAFRDKEEKNPSLMHALNLAYIGDTVFDLYIRSYLVTHSEGNAHSLHLRASKIVCAAGQAEAFHRIEDKLTEQELAVFKRGRNAHSGTVPKNAHLSDYRIATGMEALIGFLYLSSQDERLTELINFIMEEV